MSDRQTWDYLQDMLEAARRIVSYIEDASFEQFQEDYKTQDAVLRNLEVLGETAKNIPDDIRRRYPDLPRGRDGAQSRSPYPSLFWGQPGCGLGDIGPGITWCYQTNRNHFRTGGVKRRLLVEMTGKGTRSSIGQFRFITPPRHAISIRFVNSTEGRNLVMPRGKISPRCARQVLVWIDKSRR
jgi:hypothetical protein